MHGVCFVFCNNEGQVLIQIDRPGVTSEILYQSTAAVTISIAALAIAIELVSQSTYRTHETLKALRHQCTPSVVTELSGFFTFLCLQYGHVCHTLNSIRKHLVDLVSNSICLVASHTSLAKSNHSMLQYNLK